jgi:ribosomal protein S27E
MFDKLKGAAGSVATKAGSLKDAGTEALQATVAELNATLPQLREVGFSVNRVALEIGLSPKIILTLTKVFDVDGEAFAAVLAANAERKTFCTILGALQKANQMQAKIHFQNRHFRAIDIELAIPPAIRMIFLEGASDAPPRVEQPRTELPLEAAPQPLPPVESETLAEPPPVTESDEPLSEPPSAPAEEPMEEAEEPTPPAPEPPPEEDEEEAQWLRMWCEGCQRDYRVSMDKAGLKARCRRCGTWIFVPHLGE